MERDEERPGLSIDLNSTIVAVQSTFVPREFYLLRSLIISNIGLHAKRPLNVQVVLVQLQQEDDQHEERVDHEEGKH